MNNNGNQLAVGMQMDEGTDDYHDELTRRAVENYFLQAGAISDQHIAEIAISNEDTLAAANGTIDDFALRRMERVVNARIKVARARTQRELRLKATMDLLERAVAAEREGELPVEIIRSAINAANLAHETGSILDAE